MTLDLVAWHNRASADHTSQVDKYFAQGYRTASLSVYGDPADPLYAAVMIKRATVFAEEQHIDLTAAAFQQQFDRLSAKGFGPLLVTATGPTDDPRYAASWFEIGYIPLTRPQLTAAEFTAANRSAQGNGLILASADAYGDPGNLRYVAVWVRNTDQLAWNCDGLDDDAAASQARFNALIAGFGRPRMAAVTPDVGQLTLYDDSTGGAWLARGNMTAAEYQQNVDAFWPRGQRPLRVSGKGTGPSARFAAIWGTQETRDARTWRFAGSPAVAAIDQAVQTVMTGNQLRGASLAILEGTRLVYARGYTNAEPDYPSIDPTTTFRQASVSKLFCAAAIWQLIGEDLLTLDSRLADVLALTPPTGTHPAHYGDITIAHLLEMTSGITTSVLGTDPQVSTTLPITAYQTANWLSGRPLGNVPGDRTKATYSNAGYLLLGLVVAKLRGHDSFIGALQAFVAGPLHMSHTVATVDRADQQITGEARYHSRPLQTGASVVNTGQPPCALGYGDCNVQNTGGGGGISASAVDVARLLAAIGAHADTPLMKHTTAQTWLAAAATASATLSGPDAHGYHGFDSLAQGNGVFSGYKGGSLSTSQNGIWLTTGGISTVLCWNGATPNPPGWYPNYPDLLTAATAQTWGAADLFPTYGMPTLTPPLIGPPHPPIHFPPVRSSHMSAGPVIGGQM